MKIYLIGMPLAGKSVLGKQISAALKLNLIDLDDEIEKNNLVFISEIFEIYGEETFRQIESEALKSLIQEENCVIVCGGGIVEKASNLKLMNGLIVFIDADYQVLASRYSTNHYERPIFKKHTLKKLYQKRLAKYREFADITIEVNLNNYMKTDKLINIIREESQKWSKKF